MAIILRSSRDRLRGWPWRLSFSCCALDRRRRRRCLARRARCACRPLPAPSSRSLVSSRPDAACRPPPPCACSCLDSWWYKLVLFPRLLAMQTDNMHEEEREQDVRVKISPTPRRTCNAPTSLSPLRQPVSHPALLGSDALHLLRTLDSSQRHTSRQHLLLLRAPRPPLQQAPLGLLT